MDNKLLYRIALKAPTLADVAREAKVSRMTVSRILRNTGYFAPETQNRVTNAVEKLGYRPNPMVSAFMTYVRSGSLNERAGVVAYLTSSGMIEADWRVNSTYVRFFEGATERAGRLGYRLEEFSLQQNGVTQAHLSRILYARGIVGVIVGPMAASHGHLNLDWSKFSAATVGYSLLRPLLPRATNDQFDSVLIALRELYRQGYRRIGMALPKFVDERVNYHWSAGYLSFFQRHGVRPLPIYLPKIWDRKGVLRWVKTAKPKAILSTQADLYTWLIDAGYDIPGDFAYVDLDWAKKRANCAGVNQCSEEVGAAAVDLVVERINHNKFGILDQPRTLLISGKWVPGPGFDRPRRLYEPDRAAPH